MTKRSSKSQSTIQPLTPASLVSTPYLKTKQQPADDLTDLAKVTVQSQDASFVPPEQPPIPASIRNLWHSRLVVPGVVTIDGEPMTMTQSYRFAQGEIKPVGDWDPANQVHPTDALILLRLTANSGGCCGSERQRLNVFEGIYE